MEAKSLTVGSVLEERFPFAVPRYQRAYAWEDEAVGYFVRDIEGMLDNSAGSPSHFFGGVVCIELTDNQKVRPLSYEVVDGQQRLATFMLALSCVVEVAQDLERRSKKSNPAVAKRAETVRKDTLGTYMTWKDADVAAGKTRVRPRMTLSLADDDIFQALVMSAPKPACTRESHRLLTDARAALLEMTWRFVGSTGSLDARVTRLFRLRQAIVQDAHLIHIVSKERSQAYRLFSVLNHRGESLSDSDLLRSRSLELLESYPIEHEEVAKLWDEMLGAPAKDVEAFFRALYPSWTGDRAKGDLFEATEKEFFPPAPPGTSADALKIVRTVEIFRDELAVFLKLIDGTWPYDRPPGSPNKVRIWQVDRLKRLILTLKHELALPVLLAGARCLSEAKFAELVYMLEIFAFRYKIICNGHASRPASVYYRQAHLMRAATSKAAYSLKDLRLNLRALISKHAGDDLFGQLLAENLRYSNSSQRANIREFLTTLEDHWQWWHKTGASTPNANPKPTTSKVIDVDDATLEHIYPQNAIGVDRDNTLEPVKHTLGNLTFFGQSDNVAAANKPFPKKVPDYSLSTVSMTAALVKNKTWTITEVSARESELLKMALRVFVV
ncbi:DUF262 domain-containing protein [Kribbella swartbergensis]